MNTTPTAIEAYDSPLWKQLGISYLDVRYYSVAPASKSLEVCRSHGSDHKAYGWRRQLDPRWTEDQLKAYLDGYGK